MHRRTWPLRGELDLAGTLGPLRHGRADPTIRIEPRRAWLAVRVGTGPATLVLAVRGDELEACAWGPGAEEGLASVPGLAALDDEPAAIDAHHPLVAALASRFRGLRIGRTNRIFDALLPAIIEQKVTGREAFRSFRGLVHRYGERAPGPAGLWLPPTPERLASLPYYAYHPVGIEQRRTDTIRRAAARAAWLEEGGRMGADILYRRLTSLAGIGQWTAAEVGVRALGDPDAVSVGDFHLPHLVAWALAGEPRGTDARMLELLEPWRGRRARVVRLLEASGLRAPRYGPRLAPRSIEAL